MLMEEYFTLDCWNSVKTVLVTHFLSFFLSRLNEVWADLYVPHSAGWHLVERFLSATVKTRTIISLYYKIVLQSVGEFDCLKKS